MPTCSSVPLAHCEPVLEDNENGSKQRLQPTMDLTQIRARRRCQSPRDINVDDDDQTHDSDNSAGGDNSEPLKSIGEVLEPDSNLRSHNDDDEDDEFDSNEANENLENGKVGPDV